MQQSHQPNPSLSSISSRQWQTPPELAFMFQHPLIYNAVSAQQPGQPFKNINHILIPSHAGPFSPPCPFTGTLTFKALHNQCWPLTSAQTMLTLTSHIPTTEASNKPVIPLHQLSPYPEATLPDGQDQAFYCHSKLSSFNLPIQCYLSSSSICTPLNPLETLIPSS